MILQLSMVTWVIIICTLIGIFFILKSFSLPQSFYQNQTEREGQLKRKIRIEERKKEFVEEPEVEDIQDENNSEVMEEAKEV